MEIKDIIKKQVSIYFSKKDILTLLKSPKVTKNVTLNINISAYLKFLFLK